MSECTCADPQAVAQAIKDVKSGHKEDTNTIDETLYGKSQKPAGSHGSFAPIRLCSWAAPEWGPEGENWKSLAWRAAALAISIANSIAQGQIADMQQDLAESYYDMAKFKWNRFNDKYKPLELKLLNEVRSEPIVSLNCGDDRSRAAEAVNTAYDRMSSYMTKKAKQYHLCIDSTLLMQMDRKRTMALVDTANFNLSDDYWFVDYTNDKRWNRRSNVLDLGRNLSSEALKYGDVALATMKTVGGQISQAAQGLMTAVGYYGARNDTYYPMTVLGQYNSPLVSVGGISANLNPSGNLAAG
jgi:hypothetical protein